VLLVFRQGVPAQEIVRVADEESADLIVMGTHGWTGFKHLLLGSVAENVLRTAGRPVLVVSACKRPLKALEDDAGAPCPGAAA
jgi:nucleotide-binding universal stress UspA family protein